MYPVSDSLLDGLTRSHKRTTLIDIFRNGQRIVSNDQLSICAGSATVDRSAAIRRRSSFKLALNNSALFPADALDPLAPFGSEARITQYIEVDNGASATIPIGMFRLSQPSGMDDGGLTLSIATFDRARAIKRSRLEKPYTIAAGTNYILAIRALVNSRFAGLIWNVEATTTHVTPLLVLDVMTDPLDEAQKMADSIGFEFFFDANGYATLRPQPDPSTQPPVVDYIEGDSCTILSLETELSDEPGYNGAVVIGNPSTGAPVRAERWDDNALSATYYKGPYGKVPTFLKSQYIASQSQADDAAGAELRRVLGISERITFDAIPNPALDAGDSVRLRREQSRVDDVYVIESLQFPYEISGRMKVTVKLRKTSV